MPLVADTVEFFWADPQIDFAVLQTNSSLQVFDYSAEVVKQNTVEVYGGQNVSSSVVMGTFNDAYSDIVTA